MKSVLLRRKRRLLHLEEGMTISNETIVNKPLDSSHLVSSTSGECSSSSCNSSLDQPSQIRRAIVLARGDFFLLSDRSSGTERNTCCDNPEIELDDEEEIHKDLNAIALSQKFQSVTQQECRRFLNTRSMNQAEEKISNYKEWRLKYRLDQRCRMIEDMNQDDISLWEQAIIKSQWAYSSGTTRKGDFADSAKAGDNRTDHFAVEKYPDLAKQLPHFIRMENRHCDDKKAAIAKRRINNRGGRRVLYVLTNLIDSRIAPLQFYALVLAIYLDLHLDRSTLENIVTLIDVRKGKGWCNAPPISIIPFLKETVKHMEYFPERMHRCIVFPAPYPAKFIWNLAKGFLKESMVNRVSIHWGGSSIESPIPTTLNDFFDSDDLDSFESARVAEFR